jgi:hypothetical protein
LSGRQPTQSEFTLQHVVVVFGKLLSQVAEACLSRTYRDVFHFCELKNIDYLLLSYQNTGTSPLEEWAEERQHDGEV